MGLITADEVAMVGGKLGTDNSSYYLYTNQIYWSGSPFYFDSVNSRANELYVRNYGSVAASPVNIGFGTRPVVSLSPNAKLSGSGTYDDVYTVS